MKFELVHLVRYGSFSDVTLSFAQSGPALHLVYGPNEAGKSTALRAIRGLLYGIPERTGDRHRHGNDLWLRAVLSDGAGQTLEFQRRRGRKGTLRDADNEPMPEATLQRFLAGVDAQLFGNLFGLDHESLRRGAEALLFDRGAVGEALFEVGLGGRSVSRVLQEVRSEADEIFLPRSTKRKLNAALDGFRDANRRASAEALHTEDYEAHARAVSEAERELSGLRERRKAIAEERGKLQRIASLVVPLGERRRLLQAQHDLGQVRLLAPEARQGRVAAVATLTGTEPELKQLQDRHQRLTTRLDGLEVPETLVALGDEVQALRDQLGSHRKAAQDLPRRRHEMRSLQAEARATLRRLGWTTSLKEVERHRLSRPQVVRIRELSRRAAALEEGLEQARDVVGRAQAAGLAAEEGAQATTGAPASLHEALQAVQQLGNLDERRAELAAVEARTARELTDGLARLLPALPSGADLRTLPLPGEAAVRAIAEEALAASHERSRLQQASEARQHRIDRAAMELAALTAEHDLPSETDLQAVRERRNGALSAALEGGVQASDAASALGLVRDADQVADRMRSQAARVSQVAHLRAELSQLAQEQAAAHALREADADAERERAERLLALFRPAGVTPLPAAAMGEWLNTVSGLRVQALAMQRARADLDNYDQRLRRLVGRLSDSLQEAGVEVEAAPGSKGLIDHVARLARRAAEQVELSRQSADAQRHRELRQEQRRAERHAAEDMLQRRQAELAEWRKEWGEMMTLLGLSEDASVAQAEAVVDGVDALFATVDKLEPLRGRIEGMERDRAEFERAVRRMSDRHLFRLAEVEVEEAAEELSRAHTRARRDLEERQRLSRELASTQARLDEVTLEHRRATTTLATLCRSAGVDDVDALEDAERASDRRLELEAELARVEAQIGAAGQGLSFEALEGEARDWSPESAAARLQELEHAGQGLDRDLDRASRELAQAQEAQKRLMGKEGSAAAASEAAAHVESARSLVERYVRLRLAEKFLAREIETYRKRHQAPVLERAEALFVKLTAGNYEGLTIDYTQGDQPLLCAVRDGQPVPVDGLSDGTRDQLYLALRLATLHEHVAEAEPLPLVLDDVLIHLDDERAQAALAVLGEFASVTQVLFFTHHARLVELARSVVDPGVLCEHRLDSTAPAPVQGALC